MTTLAIQPVALPLHRNDQGIVVVGETRVTLDSVVHAFKMGAAAEQIVQQYPSLALDDVYVVIAYYLRNVADVESYLQERANQRDAVRGDAERRFDPVGLRDRLIARRNQPR